MKINVSKRRTDDFLKAKLRKKSTKMPTCGEQVPCVIKKIILEKVDTVDARKSLSMNAYRIKPKFTPLKPMNDDRTKRALKSCMRSISVHSGLQSDGIPLPKYVLFPSEDVDFHWKKLLCVGSGLTNLGNTCFLNAALQCLMYTPPLANYLMSSDHSKQCNINGQFCMLCSLQQHMVSSFSSSEFSIMPMCILNNFHNIAPHMHFGRQEDAHEFIRCLVDAMQKSCLHGLKKLDSRSKATTVVYAIFGGYLRSRINCFQCEAVSDTFDPFLDVSLDINLLRCHDLENCFEYFVTPQELFDDNSYLCPCCKTAVSASKTLSIHRPPNILTVHLKRFSSFVGSKLSKDITYPSKLNIKQYMSQPQKTDVWYILYAVLVHSGYSCQFGHYYAYAKAGNGQWYSFNDSSVQQVSADEALKQEAYMLFYHKITLNSSSSIIKCNNEKSLPCKEADKRFTWLN